MLGFQYIDEIVSRLLDDSFSIFCGAGASADATQKSWVDIFSSKTQIFYNHGFSDDIYFLADLERNYYNSEHFYDDIARNLEIPPNIYSNHIEAIINLNINQFWTTNFDNAIENSIKDRFGVIPTVIKESRDLLSSKLIDTYIIYKLNGAVSDYSSMVLTKSDYFNYYKQQRLLFEQLKRQLVLDSFLFVGYSFKDDLVLSALREIKETFPENGNYHYRFVTRNYAEAHGNPDSKLRDEFDKLEEQYFFDKYNIKTIATHSFLEIDDYLNETYKRFCNHNVFFCGSFREIPTEDRQKIERIVDVLVSTLFQNQFQIYSGNGRGLGEIVFAQADKHKKRLGGKLINRPLIFSGDDLTEKEKKNHFIMKDCNTIIIICGQDETLQASKNVKTQFEMFLDAKSHCAGVMPLVIPIPATGFAAEEIFYCDTFRNSLCYRTEKEVYKRLEFCQSAEEIASIIVNLIRAHSSDPNS